MGAPKAFYRGWVRMRRRWLGIPQPGLVNFGDLARIEPFGRDFGTGRGQPIDRFYIERFLGRHSGDVRGRVLEVGNDTYTRRYGWPLVTQGDILHVDSSNPRATIVADLAAAPQIPDRTFDAIVLTQVLNLVYDARAAVRTLHRILKPGGVLLMTTPGITQVPHGTDWAHTWYWAFTELAVRRMLGEAFGEEHVNLEVGGNVLAATAFLQGLAVQDVRNEDLEFVDRNYPVIIAARAQRAA